jgi:hypothetical protein
MRYCPSLIKYRFADLVSCAKINYLLNCPMWVSEDYE